jgi:serine protease AprX
MFTSTLNQFRVTLKKTLTIAAVLLFASAAFAKNPKLTSDLEAVDANSTVSVIVRYKVTPQDTHVAKAKKYGAKLKFKHTRFGAVSYKIKRSQLEKLLADDTNIAMISPDRPIKSMNDFTAASVGANIAQSLGFDGQGIGVAIIDSGVMDHPDLHNYKKDQKNGDVNRIVYSESFVENAANANDKNGHGTHVAGIVAGNGNSSTCNTCTDPIVGIAPGVNIVNLQVLDAQGNGSDSATIAAIDRAIELKDKYNIRVINMSMGRPVYESYKTDPLCQAVEAAWKSGIVVVVSAGNLGRNTDGGNNGYGTITAPGNDPYVITVGAMKADGTDSRNDDAVASYSSKGPSLVDHVVKPDIVAPGNKVESLYVPDSTLANLEPEAVVPVSEYNPAAGQPAYFRMSGTSMAAPVVAGAAALLIEKNPSLTPDQVKAQLMTTATRNFPQQSSVTDPTTGNTYTSNYDVFTVGAGYLDIQNAINNDVTTTAALGAAQSPTIKHDDLTGTMTFNQVPGSVWDATTSSTVWGPEGVSAEGIIWGSLNVSGTASSVIWSEGIIWGSAGVGAEGIIWGSLGAEGIIWGSLGSEGIIWGSLGGE